MRTSVAEGDPVYLNTL